MKLNAESLRNLILSEARKIQSQLDEDNTVEVTPEILRQIIQEEAERFEADARISEEFDKLEESLIEEMMGKDQLPDLDEDEVVELEMLDEEDDFDIFEDVDEGHCGGAMEEEEALEEDSFRQEMDHDRRDVNHLRRIRDELNNHIHNLEMQDDRAHERDPHLHEEDDFGTEFDPRAKLDGEDEGEKGEALEEEEHVKEMDHGDKAEEGAKLSEGQKAAARLLRAAGIKNEVITEGKLNEEVSNDVSRWLRLSGLR